MRFITLSLFILLLILFRPYQWQDTSMMYLQDDYDYFAHASAIVYGQFPNYDKEFFDGQGQPLGSIGSGLLAVPFVYVFSWIDRLNGADIVHHRTQENIKHSWSQFGFIIAAHFYLWFGCFLLFKALNIFFEARYAVIAIFLVVLSQGIPLFAFRRPLFTHIFEFFLQALCVSLMCYTVKRQSFNSKKIGELIGIGIVVALIFLVRFNNIFMALIWPILLIVHKFSDLKKIKTWINLGVVFGSASLIILLFKIWPTLSISSEGYSSVVGTKLLTFESVSFYIQRVLHIIFGVDWGLIYTAPFILIALVFALFGKIPLKKRILVALLPMLVNAYVIIAWKTQGGWYGYRYFITSIIPLLTIPMAYGLKYCDIRFTQKINILWCLIAIFPFLSMIAFEGVRGYLTLTSSQQYFGTEGWGNNMYQMQIWHMILTNPQDFLYVVLNGGPLYLAHLATKIVQNLNLNTSLYSIEYLQFNPSLLLRVIVIYSLPFVLHLLIAPRFKNEFTQYV